VDAPGATVGNWKLHIKSIYFTHMEKNLSVIGVLIVCVILLGGLYALTQGPSAPTPLTPDQVQLLETKKDDYTKGPKDAKVVLTEYFDYECPL
jgi:protein-disulfide isomerase